MTTAPTITGWRRGDPAQDLLDREWLVTNSLGGYAAGSLSGHCTRRFHGLVIAALPAPLGRTMFVPYLEETLHVASTRVRMTALETMDELALPDADWLEAVELEEGLPVWQYACGGAALEKRLFMPHLRNVTCVRYRLCRGDGRPVSLELRPYIHVRGHEERLDTARPPFAVETLADGCRVTCAGYPPLTIRLRGAAASFDDVRASIADVICRVERARGYDYRGCLESPGKWQFDIAGDEPVWLVVSVDDQGEELAPQEALDAELSRRRELVARAAPSLREGPAAQLVLAADQFVIMPQTRLAPSAAETGDRHEARTIIAGYHWFTDWGRDTMISLEGLCLLTGRLSEARRILHTFARYVRDGLIPNMFPEGETAGRYHTADATLWFFHAVDRYLQASGDRETLATLLPVARDIVDHHLRGTRFGIHVDTEDGLLVQGEAGYQLTWMDAKVGNWVVTPRRGKAVEINALFYNALMLLAAWLRQSGADGAHVYEAHAERMRSSFNRRFWSAALGHLYDVVDTEPGGDDDSLRPNQIIAVSLTHAVLAPERWAAVVNAVECALLTPVGVRTLTPAHHDYKGAYDGDLLARDAAYHQGTVWPWLIGPFMDAWFKVHDDMREGEMLVQGLFPHLADGCLGTISEIFDAEPPYRPRGCAAQAWSVAELLRVTALMKQRSGSGAGPATAATS